MQISQFKIGDIVTARSYTDCFGVHHDAISGLTISSVKLIKPSSIPSYYRIAANKPAGGYIEGAESFFVAAVLEDEHGPMIRCAAFKPGSIQCHLPMYHDGKHIFEPATPFSIYVDEEEDSDLLPVEEYDKRSE